MVSNHLYSRPRPRRYHSFSFGPRSISPVTCIFTTMPEIWSGTSRFRTAITADPPHQTAARSKSTFRFSTGVVPNVESMSEMAGHG